MAFFAHDYVDKRFMNEVMHATIRLFYYHKYLPSSKQIQSIYANLPTGAPMKRALLDQYCSCGSPTSVREHLHDYPKEFFVDIWALMHADQYTRKVPRPSPARMQAYDRSIYNSD